jgi:nucleoside diphosphate kinase
MGQMTTPNPLIIIIWTCQEMMTRMSMELIGSVDVIWWNFGSEVGQIRADFCQTLKTNLTQHDSHGPDDNHKTIIIIWTCQEMRAWCVAICWNNR